MVQGFNMDLNAPVVHSINDTESQFGFSVAMHRHSGENMVIVGAPRYQTDELDVTRGGALFRCPLNSLTNPEECEELSAFNSLGNEFNEEGNRIANKSGQWFGASVKSAGENGKILACRPLYTWFIQPEGGTKSKREPIGGCFIATSDFSNIQLYEPCRSTQQSEQSTFGVTHCEAGIAADISSDEILIGAPGSFFWQGQIWVANTDLQGERRTNEGPTFFDDSYRGYAVAFGDFKGDPRPEYAVGIPRARGAFGMVSIFDSSMNAYLNITGSQVGAYFGHTLVVSDFNADGSVDLVVSAPFFIDEEKTTNGWDIGRVRIFYNDGNAGFSEGTTIQGYKVSSRFGFSMAALNDVNQDGYNDLAVSAPTGGQSGEGIVYIYHSKGRLGLSTIFAQSLEPSDFGLSLQSFGSSLSAGMDMDNNRYPDLVIGAYKSATIVLVRSRPIVHVTGSLVSTPGSLNLKVKSHTLPDGTAVTSFDVKVCIRYSGTNAPANIDFDYTISLDYNRQTTRRANFDLGGSDPSTLSRTVTLTANVEYCNNFTAYVKPSIVDKLSPIPASVVFGLTETTPSPGEILPIRDLASDDSNAISVPIERDCMNQTCVPDLSVRATTGTERLIVGASESIAIDVTIANNGEDAYLSTLTVEVPPELQYTGFTRVQTDNILTCSNNVQSSEISCDIGNPFSAGVTVILQLQFSSENLPGNGDNIDFTFRVSSVESEQMTSDNEFNISVPLEIKAELSFHGNVIPETIIYDEEEYLLTRPIKLQKHVGPEITHVFSLYNNGPSSVAQTEITILWPMWYNSRQNKNYLLYLLSATMDTGDECTIDGTLNPEELASDDNSTLTPDVVSSRRRRRRATGTEPPPVGTTDIPMSTTESPLKVQDIECSGSQTRFCYAITCAVDSLGAGSNAARNNIVVTLRSRVWTNTLTMNSLELTVFVEASARVLSVPYETQFTDSIEISSNKVSTKIVPQFIIPEIEPQKVPLWVYLASILGGCFILVMLILILWKVGFFKRRKKLTSDQRKMLESRNGVDNDGVDNTE
ncbi:integrin alpha-V-like [Lytechinus pictus]|uniref:integrin alpha-V-like n=1 Tax=Lytechinus pictus TaxID=7653 RepID=UPI0030BA190C